MNRSEQHPDSILLDRLRAGLLDDDPLKKAAVDQHLQQCDGCRRAYDWPAGLRSAAADVDEQLNQLRRRALAAPANRSRRWLPVAAAAALALVAVALFHLLPTPDTGEPRVAASSQAVPDLYEDLDFYLWLADHKSTSDSST
jgi:hypothetical protein